ncbi:MAG: hypothetical protein JWN03_6423 [Nocardia sp.]|uniref:hypothetical protein n=1 Tax=Nocardia sp. TaxID=1821 RepID=UPI002630DA2E|nr:hypothetical protein [Nocardia sp.]MCU1646148.1 hypothetical protein [Nocardia sp.]
MTESLTMAAIENISQTVNSYAAAAAGVPLPHVTWMWDCCGRFASHAAGSAEFCGTIHPDMPEIEAKAQLMKWAIALNMVDATTAREAADGRRAFTGEIGDSRIRLTAVVESSCPSTETQPLMIIS